MHQCILGQVWGWVAKRVVSLHCGGVCRAPSPTPTLHCGTSSVRPRTHNNGGPGRQRPGRGGRQRSSTGAGEGVPRVRAAGRAGGGGGRAGRCRPLRKARGGRCRGIAREGAGTVGGRPQVDPETAGVEVRRGDAVGGGTLKCVPHTAQAASQ